MTYSDYISENINKTSKYKEYLESIDATIKYSEYIAERVDKSIKYSEYMGGYEAKIKRIRRRKRIDTLLNKDKDKE